MTEKGSKKCHELFVIPAGRQCNADILSCNPFPLAKRQSYHSRRRFGSWGFNDIDPIRMNHVLSPKKTKKKKHTTQLCI
jgi:hypothetical protein